MESPTIDINYLAGLMQADYLADAGEPAWRIIGHALREQKLYTPGRTEHTFWMGCYNRSAEIQEGQQA